MKLRIKGNLIHVLRDYDYADRKHSGQYARNSRSRSHSRRARRRTKAGAR